MEWQSIGLLTGDQIEDGATFLVQRPNLGGARVTKASLIAAFCPPHFLGIPQHHRVRQCRGDGHLIQG